MEQRIMVFWMYDRFPYLLGDEVEEIGKDGWVRTKNYSGLRCLPKFFLPLKEGKILKQKLEQLEVERMHELDVINKKYLNMINELIYPVKIGE